MNASLRSAVRSVYEAIPFKGFLFPMLRRVWAPEPTTSRHLFFRGPFDLPIGGATLRLTNHDSPHETALFWHGVDGWPERISLRYWIMLCRHASTIADVGANIGIYSLVAKLVNPAATVWAFEPIPRFFDRLVANCLRNQLAVRCFNCAVSNQEGEASLWDLPVDHHYHASLLRADMPAHPGVLERRVRTRTLENVLLEDRLDGVELLKIDVEGWEPEVLESLGKMLQRRPTILVEIKSFERARRIESLVAGLGYLFYDIDETEAPSRHPHLGPSGKWNWLLCQPGVARDLGLS